MTTPKQACPALERLLATSHGCGTRDDVVGTVATVGRRILVTGQHTTQRPSQPVCSGTPVENFFEQDIHVEALFHVPQTAVTRQVHLVQPEAR